MQWRWLTAAVTLILATACGAAPAPGTPSPATEISARTALMDTAGLLLRERKFSALNALAADLRKTRSRTPSGTWKLSFFHTGIEAAMGPYRRGTGCVSPKAALLREWHAAEPSQPAAYIAQATDLTNEAWCWRGGGYAGEVDRAAMAKFVAKSNEALRLLTDRRREASIDPEYYTALMRVRRGLGIDRSGVEALLDEAVTNDPYYYSTYFQAAQNLLPQWGGGPGDIDWLGRYAVAKTREQDGESAYARIAWYLDGCNCLDWTEPKRESLVQGLLDLARIYPDDWNLANAARLACLADDRESTRSLLAGLKRDLADAWPDLELRGACYRRSDIPEKPLLPATPD